jgi:HAMP domain-containing protein
VNGPVVDQLIRLFFVALFAVAAAAALALIQVRQLARPLERLARSATQVGEGDFTADATHQLRTSLTGAARRVEIFKRHSDPEVVEEADTIFGRPTAKRHTAVGCR